MAYSIGCQWQEMKIMEGGWYPRDTKALHGGVKDAFINGKNATRVAVVPGEELLRTFLSRLGTEAHHFSEDRLVMRIGWNLVALVTGEYLDTILKITKEEISLAQVTGLRIRKKSFAGDALEGRQCSSFPGPASGACVDQLESLCEEFDLPDSTWSKLDVVFPVAAFQKGMGDLFSVPVYVVQDQRV